MLTTHFYYSVRPYVPWRVRIGLRRVIGRWKRRAHRASWPINEAAARPPEGWTGWPGGQQFAFVLTHDVEGPAGLAKCRQLAEIERRLGFRSAFNLIPEGSYRVPPELRAELIRDGFEIGIHDLRHDGKLFRSRTAFRQSARRINHYVRDWGAAGYRSGFMLRQLDWLHDLDIAYDTSTFDTDPFEPQPDGTGTIFPFWIQPPQVNGSGATDGATARQRGGYVELPYTLPQDSTAFLILGERTPDLWRTKLDWIARHGGMALINVHPDYLRFDGEPESRSTFPVQHYIDLLTHVRDRYAGRYWQALPREVAHWYREQHVAPTHRLHPSSTVPERIPEFQGKRAAVLLYSDYPADPRPRRAATALAARGMEVDLLCLQDSDDQPLRERIDGVNVFRVRMQRRRASKLVYLWQYARFLVSAFTFLTRRGLTGKYDVVHVHNMPDALCFAAAVPKLLGARVILDLHDPMPEVMMAIYGLREEQRAVRVLRLLERWSIRFSDVVLTPNIAFKRLFASRSCAEAKIQIVMNSPQEEIFRPDGGPRPFPARDTDEFRLMHHGSIVHRHGVDQLVEAVAQLRAEIPGLRLDIYGGETPFLDTVLRKSTTLGVDDIVRYHGPKSQREIAAAIEHCHLGIVPNRRSLFTDLNFPTRLFEYLAMQRPVIAPGTAGIRDYFSDDAMIMFEPNNVADLVAKIRWVRRHPAEVQAILARGRQVYQRNLWSREKQRFLVCVDQLLETRGAFAA